MSAPSQTPRMPTLQFHALTTSTPLGPALPQTTVQAMPALPSTPTSTRTPTRRGRRERRSQRPRARPCPHCNVSHHGGPFACRVNQMRIPTITLTSTESQTDPADSCNRCDPLGVGTAATQASPSLSTYSSIGPISPSLTVNSPPNFTSPPTSPHTSTSLLDINKPSVRNARPLVEKYRQGLQRRQRDATLTQAGCFRGIMSLTCFKESRYIAELFLISNEDFLILQHQNRDLKVLKTFNRLCKEVLERESLKPLVKDAKNRKLIF